MHTCFTVLTVGSTLTFLMLKGILFPELATDHKILTKKKGGKMDKWKEINQTELIRDIDWLGLKFESLYRYLKMIEDKPDSAIDRHDINWTRTKVELCISDLNQIKQKLQYE
jgi:hypothetical protein